MKILSFLKKLRRKEEEKKEEVREIPEWQVEPRALCEVCKIEYPKREVEICEIRDEETGAYRIIRICRGCLTGISIAKVVYAEMRLKKLLSEQPRRIKRIVPVKHVEVSGDEVAVATNSLEDVAELMKKYSRDQPFTVSYNRGVIVVKTIIPELRLNLVIYTLVPTAKMLKLAKETRLYISPYPSAIEEEWFKRRIREAIRKVFQEEVE